MWSTLLPSAHGSSENESMENGGGQTEGSMHVVSDDHVLSNQNDDDDDNKQQQQLQPPTPPPQQRPNHSTISIQEDRPVTIPTGNMGNMTTGRLFDTPYSPYSPSHPHRLPISRTSYFHLPHGASSHHHHHHGGFVSSMHHGGIPSISGSFNDMSGSSMSTSSSSSSSSSASSSSHWNSNKILSSRSHSPVDHSPFPLVDQFVRSQANIGGVQGEITSWYLYTGKSR